MSSDIIKNTLSYLILTTDFSLTLFIYILFCIIALRLKGSWQSCIHDFDYTLTGIQSQGGGAWGLKLTGFGCA